MNRDTIHSEAERETLRILRGEPVCDQAREAALVARLDKSIASARKTLQEAWNDALILPHLCVTPGCGTVTRFRTCYQCECKERALKN